ncbi:MAG TPA: RIO1 family regulatory kinase/ATPase [Roseiflexaceae bacterium]|nr:RIO1 family regulatory kinase/ATPase [Roseiflexaceae bacterium]
MSDDETYFDDLEFYEAKFNREPSGRKGVKRKHDNRPERALEAAGLAEATGAAAEWTMTYAPARFEAVWLRASLASFYEEEWISDVLASVKGGKEANVYRCQAHPNTGEQLLVAKVYRPRQFRNLRNDKAYRDGRAVLTPDGRPVKNTDHRLMRALGKKTAFGQQVSHTSWLMHEYTTLERLHQLGAAVPKPFASNENAMLMTYWGDERQAAPTLSSVRLDKRTAQRLFEEVMRNIELMLAEGLIHGDLSAYNILYWEEQITLIDFPQVTHLASNRNARAIFQRDVVRVCDYFLAQGVRADPNQLVAELWEQHGDDSLDDLMPLDEEVLE